MKNCLPNSELEVINRTGHAIHVEQFDIFGRIVSEFLTT